ncbi:hypothetical protein CEXT_758041 [Caerostris extrusa]|uniref:Uncharacterized protein n=1 Tax=Caerostris extrusa TaxID=172846 RepID=A0AAV4U7G9_CAEEX|nr:hypothetical protein CEXT_758041 [Caerostris extrusa]
MFQKAEGACGDGPLCSAKTENAEESGTPGLAGSLLCSEREAACSGTYANLIIVLFRIESELSDSLFDIPHQRRILFDDIPISHIH